MNKWLSILLLLTGIQVSLKAQGYDYIRTNWYQAKKSIYKGLNKDNLKFVFNETDTSYLVTLNDSNFAKEELYLHFSEYGICNHVKLFVNCSECMKKHFDEIIANKHYQWREINENQYASKVKGKLILEIMNKEEGKCPYIYLHHYPGKRKAFRKMFEAGSQVLLGNTCGMVRQSSSHL